MGELLAMGLCVLAMTVLMMYYMDDIRLIEQKTQIGQLCRCYLLKMETVGYLTAADRTELTRELDELGMTQIDYGDSTLQEVGYGEKVILEIHGVLGETYEISERRVSTAKN